MPRLFSNEPRRNDAERSGQSGQALMMKRFAVPAL
jgi:hypothetical protein